MARAYYVVERSVFRGNGGTWGILVVGNSDANRVEHNTVSDPALGPGVVVNGFDAEFPDRNVVSRNAIYRGGVGVGVLYGSDNVVERNFVYEPGTYGISAILGPRSPVVDRNRVIGAGISGIRLADHHGVRGSRTTW